MSDSCRDSDAKRLRNDGITTVEFALGTDTVHPVDGSVTAEAIDGKVMVYARLVDRWHAAIEDGTEDGQVVRRDRSPVVDSKAAGSPSENR